MCVTLDVLRRSILYNPDCDPDANMARSTPQIKQICDIHSLKIADLRGVPSRHSNKSCANLWFKLSAKIKRFSVVLISALICFCKLPLTSNSYRQIYERWSRGNVRVCMGNQEFVWQKELKFE